MRHVFLICMLVSVSIVARADFFSFYDSLFQNQEICDENFDDQGRDGRLFQEMFIQLQLDEAQNQESDIEVTEDSMYTATLQSKSGGYQCTIILHDDCYSAFCE